MNKQTVETNLQTIIDHLNQEWIHLQILGRALTPEELKRSATLARVLEHLRVALALLTGDASLDSGGTQEDKESC